MSDNEGVVVMSSALCRFVGGPADRLQLRLPLLPKFLAVLGGDYVLTAYPAEGDVGSTYTWDGKIDHS